jgi:hypothetical protein
MCFKLVFVAGMTFKAGTLAELNITVPLVVSITYTCVQ